MKVLPEQIAATLSERVIHGTYPPGHRLIEAALSAEFGVSHGPVRDALRILHASGLVTIHPYRGAHVTQLSVREVRELYEVRAALVSIRARWIAEEPQPHRANILDQVEARIAGLAKLAEDDASAEEFSDESAAVNNLLTESLPNRWLRSTIQGITLQTSRYSRLALITSRERRQEAAHLWRMLFNAMASGDADLAEKVGATLSLTARDAAINYLNEHGSEPVPAKPAARARRLKIVGGKTSR